MTHTEKPYCFFLGGMDLEMQEIEKILLEHKEETISNKLSWKTAKLSSYKASIKERKKTHCLVFIELTIDDDTILKDLTDYRIIDHHDENDSRLSSIEQVAALLNIELSDYHRLVAINDRAYIPGLLAEGLSRFEIEEIREKDWEAQGIAKPSRKEIESILSTSTSKDSDLQKNPIEQEADITTIHVRLNLPFAPIVDYLTLEEKKTTHLILYNKDAIVYYGPGVGVLRDKFAAEINNKEAYSGGGFNGYFGLNLSKSSDEPKDLARKIATFLKPQYHLSRNIDRLDEIYSYHIFSFPFKLQSFPVEPAQNVLNGKSHWESVLEHLQEDWENNKYELSAPVYYNEFNYFYDFTRDALFDLGPDSKDIYFRSYNLAKKEDRTYKIQIAPSHQEPGGKTYVLSVDSLTLQLHPTGVGVLTFHLKNKEKEQSKPIDIQRINQFGRRIYPPFLMTSATTVAQTESPGKDAEWILALKGENFDTETKNPKSILGVQDLELAKSLTVLGFEETFDAYLSPVEEPRIPAFIQKLLWKDSATITTPPIPILDDRMFVLSWYGHDLLSSHLGQGDASGNANFLNDDWWYEYVFVDNPQAKSCPYPPLARQHIEQSTNARWSSYSTLFGVTRYSFVLLTPQWSTLQKNNTHFLLHHLQTLYFKMVNLCLIQKASLLTFSDQIKMYTNDPAKIKAILKNYSVFVNRQYFREVTAQAQGIELYKLLQNQMGIAEEVVFLERELHSHHNILVLQESEASNEKNERLNRLLALLSTILAVPGIALAYYGINVFDDQLSPFSPLVLGGILLLILGASFFAYRALHAFMRKETGQKFNRNETIHLALAVVFFILIFILPFCFERAGEKNEQQLQQGGLKKEKTLADPKTLPVDSLLKRQTDSLNNRKSKTDAPQ
ncbi:hypothetical protein [Haliscomenobacter hydrossis]|uniref:Mg2 transporter protein CorA family protein n=1 Tax=Haliscomenobacter hydrossis (strain ATCC 27775 / DSM 1100 / LMG 10767 / O) TaxID=760192 RepID=F4L838_HALH1|nr:hypothetical protein [Haliscomenobacter hydrossis]AEE54546.1 hypothetical protein Halhy_6731 [Haliscomenobacter hydrossis DSM 1100]